MRDSDSTHVYRFGFVVAASLFVSVAFLFVIHIFIIDLILAAIFPWATAKAQRLLSYSWALCSLSECRWP
jgi:hypothetical protein